MVWVSILGVDVLVVMLMWCLLVIYVGLIWFGVLIMYVVMLCFLVILCSWFEFELFGLLIMIMILYCGVMNFIVFWWFCVV